MTAKDALKIKQLEHEVKTLRSVIVSFIGKDQEGTYQPDLVKKILSASKEKPAYTFHSRKNFLQQIQDV